MKLHQQVKIVAKSKKRVGRGLGSGRGKTSGRGTKGAKARGKMPLGFAGGTLPLYKKLPYRRGLGNPKVSPKLLPLNVSKLSVFEVGSDVNLQTVSEAGLVDGRKAGKQGVKIVGQGELKVALTVYLPTSTAAARTIEKAGGKVV